MADQQNRWLIDYFDAANDTVDTVDTVASDTTVSTTSSQLGVEQDNARGVYIQITLRWTVAKFSNMGYWQHDNAYCTCERFWARFSVA